ncbi:MAG: VanZ family protein [Candidatus Omnitrophica bacterium]|nr:VanZ family protein [Candidatus Omnitrophota bacterium]MCB9720169.1 VanZ family protein [Candidatus Omnitrophota bacterium]
MTPAVERRGYGVATAYILVIGLIIFLADTGRLGPVAEMIRRVPYGDAVLHALLMGFLAVAVNQLLNGRTVRAGRVTVLLGTLLVVAFVVIEETTQLFIASRTFSLIDLGADFIGIGLAGIIRRKIQK